MSVKALSAVFEDSRARGSAFVVLLAMADWADHNGWCYPSYGQIAAKARVSRATAIAAIRELEQLGELQRKTSGQGPTAADEEAPANVRSQWRNLYHIALVKPAKTGSPAFRPPATDQVVQSTKPGGLNDVGQVVQSTDLHIRKNRQIDPSDRPSEKEPRSRGLFSGPTSDPFLDSAITERAGEFIRLYRELHRKHRQAAYLGNERRDYDAAVRLCHVWTDDARLEKLAIRFLTTTDHDFAVKNSRTIPRMAVMASLLDGELAASEKRNRSDSQESWTPERNCPHTPKCGHRTRCDTAITCGRTSGDPTLPAQRQAS